MKKLLPFCAISAVLCGSLSVQASEAQRPNIVFLLSDDQGWTDYGFMGHEQVQTPHLDKLATSGLIYERGYVTAPLCRPSLASLASGRYPHEMRIRGNDPLLPEGVKKRTPLYRELQQVMADGYASEVTVMELLKDNGYLTLQTGKWWEGKPQEHGFTHAMTHGDFQRGARHGDKGLTIGRSTMQPIIDFVDESIESEKPFFIWYGVYLPHSPHDAPDRLYNKYKDIAPNEPTARYWANIDWLDETCGQIVDLLKEKGLYENTLFIYTADNGWLQNPKKIDSSIASKREPTEMGIRTPIFITHEGAIKPQRDNTTLASNIDIATTILRACGIEPPSQMSGLDLRDPKALQKRDRIFVDVYEHDIDLEKLDDIDHGVKARVVIDGWDKLIQRPDRVELYDLKTDNNDVTDLSSKNKDTVARLEALISDYLK